MLSALPSVVNLACRKPWLMGLCYSINFQPQPLLALWYYVNYWKRTVKSCMAQSCGVAKNNNQNRGSEMCPNRRMGKYLTWLTEPKVYGALEIRQFWFILDKCSISLLSIANGNFLVVLKKITGHFFSVLGRTLTLKALISVDCLPDQTAVRAVGSWSKPSWSHCSELSFRSALVLWRR